MANKIDVDIIRVGSISIFRGEYCIVEFDNSLGGEMWYIEVKFVFRCGENVCRF